MKRIYLSLILTFLAALVSITARAQTVFIGVQDYPSIQNAIDNASDGDVIDITGIHEESLVFSNLTVNITLRGSDPTTDIIQPTGSTATSTDRVITFFRPSPINVNFENLGIRYGNSSGLGINRGGAVYIERNEGLVTFNNVILEDNEAGARGGAINVQGGSVELIDCTVRNNVAAGAGGALTALTNGTVLVSNYTIKSSVIHNNSATNGGAIYLDGTVAATGSITVDIENSTISDNSVNSGTSDLGGGGIWSKAAASNNVDLTLVHTTMYNNLDAATTTHNGLRFTGGGTTGLSIFNSIIVTADILAERAINFAGANTIEVKNSILGGLNSPDGPFLDDVTRNNQRGRTATQAGLTGVLSNEGGKTLVIPITENSAADDYCSAVTGITLPTADQTGFTREGNPDAGAFEFGNRNTAPTVANAIADQTFQVGFASSDIILSSVFDDIDGDALTYTLGVSGTAVTALESGGTLTLTEASAGTATVTITANDGKGGTVDDVFTVLVNNPPTVAISIADQDYLVGFSSTTIDISNTFNDADAGDILTYTVLVANTSVVTASESGGTLTIVEGGTGSTDITITANDGNGATVDEVFVVQVGTNEAPTVASAISDQLYQVGFASNDISLAGVFNDLDGDVLTYSIGVTGGAVLAVESGGTLTLTEVNAGTATVTVTANDGKGGSVDDVFSVIVNAEPVVDNIIADQVFQEGFTSNIIDVSTVFSDTDGDALTLSAVSNNTAAATVNISGSELTITEEGPGTAEITVTADDGKGASINDVFTLLINRPPTVDNPVADQFLNQGFVSTTIDLTSTFSDPDGDGFTLSVISDNTAVATVGLVGNTLTITEQGVGTSLLTISAEDTNGGITQNQFSVGVAATSGNTVSIGANFYTSISDAILASADGDIINISGEHTESIAVNDKSITLRGTDPATDVIQAAATAGTASTNVVSIFEPVTPINVTIENLGIRNGNNTGKGGGLNIEKNSGLITLNNLIIEDNAATENGGAIFLSGSNLLIIDCTIRNNTSAKSGGGLFLAPNNATSDITVDIQRTLIDSNSGTNGGGIYINGNKDFGDNSLIDVSLENVTISNNSATSAAGAEGGGAILSKGAVYTANTTTSNVSLELVHVTSYNNNHTALLKSGMQFLSPSAAANTNLSIYNSIIVSTDDLTIKALNFANTNTIDAVNNILGGLNGVPTEIIDDPLKNNAKGQTATFAGVATALTNEGGKVQVLATVEGAAALDYCSANVPVTLPTVDARNITRDAIPDAGAFENLTANKAPVVANPLVDLSLSPGFTTTAIDLSNVFSDEEGDPLTYTTVVAEEAIVTQNTSGNTLTLTEVGPGTTTVTVTADDGNGGTISDEFLVTVGNNATPVVATPIVDKTYDEGFASDVFSIAGTFTDADADVLTVTISIADEAVVTAAYNDATEELTLTEVGVGSTIVTVTADDGNGGLVADEFSVTVNANVAPVVANQIASKSYEVGFTSEVFSVAGTFTDADGDALDITVNVADETVITAAYSNATEELTLTEQGEGSTQVTLTASDGKGGSVDASFTVSVNAASPTTVFIGDVSYPSIDEALLAAVNGDVIDITGIHTGLITVDKSVTISGTNPATDIIQASASQGSSSTRAISIVRPDETTDLNVTIQNIGVRNGNDAENGGGINADKVKGLLTLRNLIIENNSTAKNGGGVSIAGSNALIIDCTIRNNTASLDGGGVILAPNNGAGIDNQIDIYSSLIFNNSGRNGGGLYINGNKDFGDNHLIDVYIENTTINNNATTSASAGSGGGGIWTKSAQWKGDNASGNVTLEMVHVTMYNNTHSSTLKNGLQFTSTAAGAFTNFSIYNSIVVSADDIAEKALNFANTNTTDAINNIFGGLNEVPALVDDEAKNNAKGQTASFAGLITSLTGLGGNVQVLPLAGGANAIDYCTADVPFTLPTMDARQFTRDATPDAGAFEYDINNTNNPPLVETTVSNITMDEGFGSTVIDISGVFSDPDGDAISLSASSSDESVATVSITGTDLTVTEQGVGFSTITLSADDGNGAISQSTFTVTVNGTGGGGGGGGNNRPVVSNPVGALELMPGFASEAIDLNTVFTDPDGDVLSFQAAAVTSGVVSTSIANGILTLEEVNQGTTEIVVVANDGNGGVESESFIVTVGVILGLSDIQSGIILYPNPVTTQLSIDTPQIIGEVQFQIYDISGKMKSPSYRVEDSRIVLDVEELESGIYNIILNIDGSRIIKRFVKR